MSRRSKVLWPITAVCLIFGSYALVHWYLDCHYAVNLDEVSNIAVGMSEGEVETLLGRRADSRTDLNRTVPKGETTQVEGQVFTGPCEVRLTFVDWEPRTGPYVRIVFDDEGKVFSKQVIRYEDEALPGVFCKLRNWVLRK
jgi:hypothetical protein